jgi:PBP1b-binding outer membrane lipoprotein LpoB
VKRYFILLSINLFISSCVQSYTVQNYEDQDDGRILKAARKQHYSIFPAPISFLNDELKAELGTKSKKKEEDADDAKF